MLIEGPPGIGKSRLLAEFRRRAVADGAHVLNARAGELEREFPFGVVRQLFEAVVTDPRRARGRRGGRARGVRLARERHAHRRRVLRRAARPLLAHAQPRRRAAAAARDRRPALVRPPVACASSPTWCAGSRASPCWSRASVRTGDAADRRRADGRDRQRSRHRPRPARAAVGGGRRRARRQAARAPSPTAAFREACHGTTGGNPLLVRQLLNALETDARPARRRARRRRARDRLARRVELRAAAARAAAGRGRDRRPRGRRAGRGRRAAGRRGRVRARRGAGRGRDGRAGARRDPAPRAAARLRAPARARRRLHGPAAGRARAAARPRRRRPARTRRAARPGRGPAHAHARGAGTRRSRGCCTRPGTPRCRAAPWTAPSATCSARWRSRRARDDRPRLLLDLGEVGGAHARPGQRAAPARGLRRADRRAAAHPRRERARARAAVHQLARRGRRAWRCEAAARAAARSSPTRRSACEAFALMGVPFGAMDPREMRPVREWRGRPLETHRREDDGRGRPRSSGRRPAGTSTRSSRWRSRALAGGRAAAARPEPADARRAAADDRRRPRRGAAALRPRRWSTRTAAARCSPITGMYLWRGFTLFWRGDLIDAEEELRAVLRPGRVVGLRPGHAAVERRPSLVVPDRARQPRRGAHGADARRRERGGRSDGARYWCNARLELLVAEGRYEEAVEAADEYADRFAPLPQPRRRPLELRCGRWRSTRSGMKRKAIELAAEELDRARDWGAPGTVARSLRVLGAARRPGRAGAAGGGGRDRRPSAPAGSSWPSRWPALGVLRRLRGPARLRPRAA